MDILIKRIRQWRYDHYVTQQQLADRIGCPRNTLQCWETGRRSPGCEALAELCRAMDVSADWLLGYRKSLGGVRRWLPQGRIRPPIRIHPSLRGHNPASPWRIAWIRLQIP